MEATTLSADYELVIFDSPRQDSDIPAMKITRILFAAKNFHAH